MAAAAFGFFRGQVDDLAQLVAVVQTVAELPAPVGPLLSGTSAQMGDRLLTAGRPSGPSARAGSRRFTNGSSNDAG